MTSTGQGLGANPLLGSTELPSVASANGLTKAPSRSLSENSNVLKNNDFSNVLKRHWAVADGREGNAVSAPGGVTASDGAVLASGSFSFRDMEFSGKFSTGIAAEGGNTLPAGSAESGTAAMSTNPAAGSSLVAANDREGTQAQGEGDFTFPGSGQQHAAASHSHALTREGGADGDGVALASEAGLADSATARNGVSGAGESTRPGTEAAGSVATAGENPAGSSISGSGDRPNANGRTGEVANGLQQDGSTRQFTGDSAGLRLGQTEPAIAAASTWQTGGRGPTAPQGLAGSVNGTSNNITQSTSGQSALAADNAPLSTGTGQNPNALFASQLQSLNGKTLLQGAVEGRGLTKAATLGAEQLAAAAASALPAQSGDSTLAPAGATFSHSYTTTETPTLQTAVPVPVGKPGWNETVMQRVMWMSSQQINKAEIALDPPELGPLQVKISSQGEHTSVMFTSAHGAVRDALDQGLPRLREMLENQGLNLADVDVSDHSASQQQAQGESFSGDAEGGSSAGAGSAAEEEAQTVSQQTAVASTLSLVDQYV